MSQSPTDASGADETESAPLPLDVVFRELNVARAARTPSAALETVTTTNRVIEEFRPVGSALEWRLAEQYWRKAGVRPFIDNSVPSLVNNNGFASERAAALLLAACSENPAADAPVVVVELGSGSGLFARFFLDAFRGLCKANGASYYDRLTYIVTDRARRTVQQWENVGLFAEHPGRAVLATCDARDPDSLRALDGSAVEVPRPSLVVCNYVLDVLPAAVVRRRAGCAEQFCVRTHLSADSAMVAQYTPLTLDAIKALTRANDDASLDQLLPVATLLEFETAWRNMDGATPSHLEEALALAGEGERVLLNFGALDALDRWIARMSEEACILIRDYGPVATSEVPQYAATQRFGGSLAVGLNFPLVEHHLRSRGVDVVAPSGDTSRSIQARLVCRKSESRAALLFREQFGIAAEHFVEAPLLEAIGHARAGRQQEALQCFRTAVERSPRNWYVVGTAAEFVSLQIRDYQAGEELTRAAIELNPCYSAWLWNVLGDTYYCLSRFDAAHTAYLQAQRIDPRDARSNLNLAYTFLQRGEMEQALEAIKCGLANDREGAYRERLLEKQLQVLSALSARAQAEADRLARRAQVFQDR